MSSRHNGRCCFEDEMAVRLRLSVNKYRCLSQMVRVATVVSLDTPVSDGHRPREIASPDVDGVDHFLAIRLGDSIPESARSRTRRRRIPPVRPDTCRNRRTTRPDPRPHLAAQEARHRPSAMFARRRLRRCGSDASTRSVHGRARSDTLSSVHCVQSARLRRHPRAPWAARIGSHSESVDQSPQQAARIILEIGPRIRGWELLTLIVEGLFDRVPPPTP